MSAWSGRSALRAFEPGWRQVLSSAGGRMAVAAACLLLVALALGSVLEPQWRMSAARLDAVRAASPGDAGVPAWPAADVHAARVGALLGLARRHGIQVRGLREDGAPPTATAGVAWRALTLSAEGRYAELRSFAASALSSDAALVLDSLVLQRADTSQGLLRAEFGFAFGHSAAATERSR